MNSQENRMFFTFLSKKCEQGYIYFLKNINYIRIKENPLKFSCQTVAVTALSVIVYQLFHAILGSIISKICAITMPLISIFTVSCWVAIYFRKSLDNTNVFIIFSSCFGGELLAQCIHGASIDSVAKPTVLFMVLLSVSTTCVFLSLERVECIALIVLVSCIRLLSCTSLFEFPITIVPYLAYLSGFSGVIAAKYVEMLLQPPLPAVKKPQEKAPSIRRRRSNSTAPPCVIHTSTSGRVGRRTSLPAMIQKLAQPVRLLLAHVGEQFEDKQYETGPAPEYNRDSWLKDKAGLGLEFPSLPYLLDGDVKLTQTNAILRHLARKHSLEGETSVLKSRVDMIENVLIDFRNASIRLFYNPVFEKLKANYLKELEIKLQQFEKFIGDNKFLTGDKITFVDFILYELLDQHRVLHADCLKNFPKLTAFANTFEELPNIKSYMASSRFIKSPINNKNAKFSSSPEETQNGENEKTE